MKFLGLADNDVPVAVRETLELLEWPLLCKQLASFASTEKGHSFSERTQLPMKFSESKALLEETLEIGRLDVLTEGGLSFSGIHNLDNILSRAQKGGLVSGEELLKVANTLLSARRLRRQIFDPETRPIISYFLIDLVTLPDLEKLLRFGLEEGGRIADRASSKLASMRHQLQRLSLERKDQLNRILRKYSNIFQDSIIGNRYDRPVLSVKSGSSSQLPGIVHDTSSSGNTVFIEPQKLIPLGNLIANLNSQIEKEEQDLLRKWSAEVAKNYISLDHLSNIILKLDLALTRARYGAFLDGVAPILNDRKEAPFFLRGLRHPLLIWKEHFNKGENVVPISIEVSSEVRVISITGPNTGGKTVTLKSFGLAVLMARAGLLLPCSERPSIPWCDQVLADIGDEQSLQQSLSTFSGHLRRVNNILDAIKISVGPVLVLLDEIGAGTDPSEGTALAIALLKTLADRARLTIATTHFGELKALKYSDSRFENASVAFDIETISPTYHLQWGIPGRSNAISIARRLGLENGLIERAEELLLPSKGEEVDRMIVGLEEQRKRQQEAAEKAVMLLARTEILHEELLDNWQKQRKFIEDKVQLQREHLSKSIDEAQKEVSDLISRLRNRNATGDTARLVGQRLHQLKHNQSSRISSTKKNDPGWIPVVGEKVQFLALGKAAEVLDISEDGFQLTLLCGSFRSKVNLDDVVSIKGEKACLLRSVVSLNKKATFPRGASVRTTTNTIDVRGLRVHEAEVVLDDYLRKASGAVWVIHGIGSGKLKKGIREWLQTVPYVDRILDADPSEGGLGCSVVWLDI